MVVDGVLPVLGLNCLDLMLTVEKLPATTPVYISMVVEHRPRKRIRLSLSRGVRHGDSQFSNAESVFAVRLIHLSCSRGVDRV